MKKILVFLFIFISYFNAMAQKKTITSYKYIDGNNNTYIINAKNVEYVPIAPENSSSGVYSGGKAFNVEISAEQATEVISLLSAAVKNKEIHQETRLKGTGTIIKTTGEISKDTILKMNATEKLAIEKWLKALN